MLHSASCLYEEGGDGVEAVSMPARGVLQAIHKAEGQQSHVLVWTGETEALKLSHGLG